MNKKLFIFSLIITLTNAIFGQSGLPAFVKDSLDIYVERSMKDWNIPGLAVCIIKDGQPVLMKGYGIKALGANDKVDENTLFMIGSNTKAFTGTALALLSEEKKLSLDDKVTKWLPDFKLENKAAGEQAIIRDLLCHRIGFQTFQGDFTYWTSDLSRAGVLEKMGHIKAEYPFRTRYGYTNAAFVAAGEIIPKATGVSWEDFIRQQIFTPLGMTNSLALSVEMMKASNKAFPHTLVDGKLAVIPIPNIDNLGPAGSISSSVTDLSKWVIMQLNEGSFNGKQIIPASVIREIRKPHTIVGEGKPLFNEGHFALYGLGLFMREYEGRKIISHTGGVNGFLTSITMVPEEKLGIIVLSNSDQNEFFEALKWDILDAYLKLPYRNYSNAYLGEFSMDQSKMAADHQHKMDSVAMHLKTELPLSAYTGEFTNDVYGKMSVVLDGGQLKMKFSHHPNMYAKLDALGGNRFYAVFTDPEFNKAVFPFQVEGQKVKSVTVKVADFIEYNAYEFTKVN